MQDEPITDDEIITCWCGAKGTYDELFDVSGVSSWIADGQVQNLSP